MEQELFNELNTYFDKIFLITLKDSKDRHSWIEKELDGLDYEFFWAVNGRNYSLDELEEEGLYNHSVYKLNRIIQGKNHRPLNLARVGCALSHVSLYKHIVKEGYKRVLILEDDIYFDEENVDTFKKSVKELPDSWELLYLGYWGGSSIYSFKAKVKNVLHKFLFKMRLNKYDPKEFRSNFPKHFSKHLDRSGAYWGTHAYAITGKCAEKLMKYQEPVIMESDHLLIELCKHNIIEAFSLRDPIFKPLDKFESTIQEQ